MIRDLQALGRKAGRLVLKDATVRLQADPLAETRHLRTLRPNSVAERELRLSERYQVLFNVCRQQRQVTIVLVGEKRGEALIVRGRRFTAHESHPAE